jgi:hypothetical protein
MQPGLSFEQAPPISVPFRFFLTAPLFGMAAGLLLLWQGPAALASRWTSVALALTICSRFMLQAMRGDAADAAGRSGDQHLAAAPRHPAHHAG